MKLTILLPLLFLCSNALLIPNLDGLKQLTPVPEDAKVASEDEQLMGLFRRDNATVGSGDQKAQPYIVVYADGHQKSEYKAHDEWVTAQFSALKRRGELDNLPEGVSGDVSFYNLQSFKGYAAYLPPNLLETIKADPLVAFVEEDSIFKINAVQTQPNAPWGLARVSLQKPGATSYIFDGEGGEGVTAYVVDSGIKVEHPDFEGRATWGASIPAPQTKADEEGHGSHVAGTIGGKTYGIAKKVDLVAVRVMDADGQGTVSDIIKGIQFAVKDHQAKVAAKQRGYKGATINMSLGGGLSEALDQATNAAVSAGVHVIVAAGNENQDACNVSPARATGAITVGATDKDDNKASFSNWGKCVDINAPGVDVISVGINHNTEVLSGTSMASPHVAGLVSYFLSLQPDLGSEFSAGKLVTPGDLKRKLVGFGTRNAISGLDGSTPNVLAFNGAGKDLSQFWTL